MTSAGGKGSAPRKQRDDDKYRDSWERIFGRKKTGDTKPPVNPSNRLAIGK